MRRFGTIVRQFRQAKEMSLAAVARVVGIERGYLSDIETGRVNPPSPNVIRGIARALDCDPKPLLMRATVEKAPREIRAELRRAVL